MKRLIFYVFLIVGITASSSGQGKISGNLKESHGFGSGVVQFADTWTYSTLCGDTSVSTDAAYGFSWKDGETETEIDRIDMQIRHGWIVPGNVFSEIDMRTNWADAIYLPYVLNVDPPKSIRFKQGSTLNWPEIARWAALQTDLSFAVEKRPDSNVDIGMEITPGLRVVIPQIDGVVTSRAKVFYGLERLWSVRSKNSLSLFDAKTVSVVLDYNVFIEQYDMKDTVTDRELLIGFSYEY